MIAGIGEGGAVADDGVAGEPEAVRWALEDAVTTWRTAEGDDAASRATWRSHGERARGAAAAREHALERRDGARLGLDRAESRLASLGHVDVEPGRLVAALDAAAGLAARHREIEVSAHETARALAAAGATRDAAAAVVTRAESAFERVAEDEARERARAGDAARRFVAAWELVCRDGEADSARVPALLGEHRAAYAACVRDHAVAAQRLEGARAALVLAREMEEDARAHEGRADLAGMLDRELRRNRFIAYVQREAMQSLADAAAERLLALSSGRYRLLAEGDAFAVIDRLNGDERRSVPDALRW